MSSRNLTAAGRSASPSGTATASDSLARFFYWLPLPDHLTSEEAEVLALQKGVHVLCSHRFAMQSNKKSSYIRVSVTSPETEDDLRKGLLILKGILEGSAMEFLV